VSDRIVNAKCKKLGHSRWDGIVTIITNSLNSLK
jgi:hypothetical protein